MTFRRSHVTFIHRDCWFYAVLFRTSDAQSIKQPSDSLNCYWTAVCGCDSFPSMFMDRDYQRKMLNSKLRIHTVKVIIVTSIVWLLFVSAVYVYFSDLCERKSDSAEVAALAGVSCVFILMSLSVVLWSLLWFHCGFTNVMGYHFFLF